MSSEDLQNKIDEAWENRDDVSPATTGAVRDAIDAALDGMDSGAFRVAEKSGDGNWTVNQWLKKAVLLSFRLYDNVPMPGGPTDPVRGPSPWFDKVGDNEVATERIRRIASGEAELDGKVTDAIDLVHKLADSPRVRQSFVRHAFRYWMGRNEMLSDSATLIAADKAYVENDGSFNELLVSLLTSDSFLYRKSRATKREEVSR